MRTTSTTEENKFIDDIDEDLMDDIDGDIESRLQSKTRSRSGDYLRKIEAMMEDRRLKSDLDDYEDWDFSEE